MATLSDPPCERDEKNCQGAAVGRVCWPVEYDPDLPHASTYVCDNAAHRRGAEAWVYEATGHVGQFATFDPATERTG